MGSSSTTLKDILNLCPGNQAVHGQLTELVSSGSAVAFVGAGASHPLYPLLGQIVEALADEAISRGLADAHIKGRWLRVARSRPLQVIGRIRSSLTDPLYHAFLYDTFGTRAGQDGKTYTGAQAALMRIRFKGYVTTSFDPGLLEARQQESPDVRSPRFVLWNQDWQINWWLDGGCFEGETAGSVLFAHGHFGDPSSIVLDHDSYREAYHRGPFRRLFDELWHKQHLVLVGFCFNDPVLAQIAEEGRTKTEEQHEDTPRHIAILGLPVRQGCTREMRRQCLEDLSAKVLFYPVPTKPDGGQDHSALQVLLASMIGEPTIAANSFQSPYLPAAPAAEYAETSAIPTCFAHETTEDTRFTGRRDTLVRLDGWAADTSIRLVAITAIGGSGKTALVAHWLRHGGLRARDPQGVFFWSFYRDRDSRGFFEALTGFGRGSLNWTPSNSDASLVMQALELIRSRTLILALDGLEVIQELPETAAYGRLLDPSLGEFLNRHCRNVGSSLVLLTSRFPFPDLNRFLGSSMRLLTLPELSMGAGAELLESLGVGGTKVDREQVSKRLAGHPLALRIFARTMHESSRDDPANQWETIFGVPGALEDDSLSVKMRRLLAFYESQLPAARREALMLLSLFRAPAALDTLGVLWRGVRSMGHDVSELESVLDDLHRDGIVTVDILTSGVRRYASHPILREHFRAAVFQEPSAPRVASDLLARQPDAGEPQSLGALEIVATAIELLLDVGDVAAAHDLYGSRLGMGSVPLRYPAVGLGRKITGWFVRDDTRRDTLKENLGWRILSFYLNDAGLFAHYAGDLPAALHYYELASCAYGEDSGIENLSLVRLNMSETEIALGNLFQAALHAKDALDLAGTFISEKRAYCLARRAYIASLRGNVRQADDDFREANLIQNRINREGADLYSIRGLRWAEHLFTLGAHDHARRITEANRALCERQGWHQDVARCDSILGWITVRAGDPALASSLLQRARTMFEESDMLLDLGCVLLHIAECRLAEGNVEYAMAECDRACELAALRHFRIVQADALNLRARIRMAGSQPDYASSRDDAEAALQLARLGAYAWGQRDALKLLSTACRCMGEEVLARRYRNQAAEWDRRLERE